MLSTCQQTSVTIDYNNNVVLEFLVQIIHEVSTIKA